jgi:hypothetical protein
MIIRDKNDDEAVQAIGFGTEVFGPGASEGLYAEQPAPPHGKSGLWFGMRVTVEITPDAMPLKEQLTWIRMKRAAARRVA